LTVELYVPSICKMPSCNLSSLNQSFVTISKQQVTNNLLISEYFAVDFRQTKIRWRSRQ